MFIGIPRGEEYSGTLHKELKEDEFADLYAEELQAAGEEKISGENFVDECQVESDLVGTARCL